MQKKPRLCAALSAGMLLLSGCGAKDTDLSKRYPEFFKYTFGADYKCEFTGREKGSNTRDWYSLEYRMADGTMRQGDTAAFDVIPYKDSGDTEKMTEDEYYLSWLELLVGQEMAYLFRTGFTQDILKPCCDSLTEGKNGAYNLGADGQDGYLFAAALPIFELGLENAKSREIAETLYQPDTGVKLCAETLSGIVQDSRFGVTVALRLSAEADAAAYLAALEAAMADFRALHPQNYNVVLKQKQGEDEADAKLFSEYCILGEIVDIEARMQAQGGDYSFMKDIRGSYLAKYQ